MVRQQKSALTANKSDRLYVSDNLCVRGTKVSLLKLLGTGHRFESKDTAETPPFVLPSTLFCPQNNRQTLKVNVTNYTNHDVCSRRLKVIYETVQIDDFRRLLKTLDSYNGDGRSKKYGSSERITCIDAGRVHEDNFGVYYDELKKIIRKRRD